MIGEWAGVRLRTGGGGSGASNRPVGDPRGTRFTETPLTLRRLQGPVEKGPKGRSRLLGVTCEGTGDWSQATGRIVPYRSLKSVQTGVLSLFPHRRVRNRGLTRGGTGSFTLRPSFCQDGLRWS